MKEKIIIITDSSGKRLYDTNLETCEFYQEHLANLNTWISDLDEYEKINQKYRMGQDLLTLRNLYSLDALTTIAFADISITTSELYITQTRLKQIFYMKHLNLVIYEAFETYNSKKQFLNTLITKLYPNLIDEFNNIRSLEKAFNKEYKLNTLIKNVRHKAAGHINKEFRTWYDTVVSLEPEYTAEMAIAFMSVFGLIQQFIMKLTGCEHEKFIANSTESKRNANETIDKFEKLMNEVNLKQPDGLKLDLDIQAARDLLK